jgi:hypothetical protein
MPYSVLLAPRLSGDNPPTDTWMAPDAQCATHRSEESGAPGAEPEAEASLVADRWSALYASLYQRRQRLQRGDLRRPGRRDGFPLRLPTTRPEVDGGDVPEGPIAVVDAGADGPARHLRYGVVDGRPCAFPLYVCHLPRPRSQRRQTTKAATSTVTAMTASDQRRRRRFSAEPLLMTEPYDPRKPYQGSNRPVGYGSRRTGTSPG